MLHPEEKYFFGKNIFLVSPESWGFIFVSKHHYAMELANRGNKVYFINPPQKKLPGKIVVNAAPANENLFIVDYVPMARGLRFLPAFLMRAIERRLLRSVERKAGVRFDVIINFENSRFYDMRFAPPGVKKIYFQVDENQHFHPGIAASTADIVFAINTGILEMLKPYNEKTYKITHSFQGRLSEQAQQVLEGKYIYRKPTNSLKAVYMGNLDHMDIESGIFEEIIRSNPDIEFLLVGPYRPEGKLFNRLKDFPNAKFPGKIAYDKIPGLLAQADLLVLIYGKNSSTSSHKLLEYLGSGKAIASTYMSEFADMPGLISMANGPEEYTAVFKQVVNNIEILNNPENMKVRINYALGKSYPGQLDKIDALILETVSKKDQKGKSLRA